MKRFITILSLFIMNNLFSQQVIQVCEDTNTVFTYSTQSNVGGVINWSIDGIPYNTNDLVVDWADYPLGTHQLSAYISNYSCPSDTVKYYVELVECKETTMWAPNCFTPDGDENNNVWVPKGYNYYKEHFYIFNRWGEMIFESYSLNYGWDGTYKGEMCQEDVYVYVLEWKDSKNLHHQFYGHVTLLK